MKHVPYPWQSAAVDHAVEFLLSATPMQRQLYAAPTGCGKSVVELLLHDKFSDCWIITPRDEIIVGMLEKLQQPDADPLDLRISTPVKLRNRLLSGAVDAPGCLIVDESHHEVANTYQEIDLLCGLAPAVGYTATPYRGSPKSTRQFRQRWGEPLWLITYQEAEEAGCIKLPEFRVLPLVDDDVVDVRGGEFEVTSLEAATVDRLGDMAEHARAWHSGGLWDLPTVFAMPSSECCAKLRSELLRRGMPAVTVSAATPREERQIAFKLTVERRAALLHINIVSEGVDLPLRRLVDMAPTMSPVRWMQQLGRITRPWSGTPQYIGTNRNLLRHAYALEGCVPSYAVADADRKFPPTERAHARVLGLEAIGRFKPVSTKLASGASIYAYALSAVEGGVVVDYACLVHPTMAPVWASKVTTVSPEGVREWGRWRPCDPPDDLTGFQSVGPKQLTEKQLKWWKRSAARFGLDPEQEVNRKSFQALPVLSDLELRFV